MNEKKKSTNFPRIYYNQFLEINTLIILDKKIKHYIVNVLRRKIGDLITIFNNTNYIYYSKIINIQKNKITIHIIKKQEENNESPIRIHLIQIISKKEKMHFTIEKSVELGVSTITPIISDQPIRYCLKKKIKYWNNVIISSCAQSKRNILPKLYQPKKLNEWNKTVSSEEIKIYFHRKSNNKINQIQNKNLKNIYLIIGPEKGFSKHEMEYMNKKSFLSISLGPRILRTETAAITAITSVQILLGDIT